jgi:sugar phosphate isomerase/epimerase
MSEHPTPLSRLAHVGVMISNAWPASRATEGATAAAIRDCLAAFPDVSVIQTVDVPFAAERREIRRLVAGSGRQHTYMLTRRLNEAGLNLSALDEKLRRQSCALVRDLLADAVELGAGTVGVISGARPAEPDRRAEALGRLAASLAEIGTAARERNLQVLIEPLDFEADKRATLGTAGEGTALCTTLRSRGIPVSLCLDTAHLLLNGENVVASVASALPVLAEFHVCNAVLDRDHPLFGDRHLPFGAPGVVDAELVAEWFRGLRQVGFLQEQQPRRLLCEVLKPAAQPSLDVVKDGLHLLYEGWSTLQHA